MASWAFEYQRLMEYRFSWETIFLDEKQYFDQKKSYPCEVALPKCIEQTLGTFS